MSCGTLTVRSKGNVTVHTESDVHSTSTIVLTVDIGACEDVPSEQKLECIRSLIDLYKEIENVEGILQCVRDPRPVSGQYGPNYTVSCWRDPVTEAAGQSAGG
jgi:hypothetical protein